MTAAAGEAGPQFGVVLEGDCREVLRPYPDGCVQLCFTSPPYNVGMEYEAGGVMDGELTFDQWIAFLREALGECTRLLAPGGHLVVNVPQGVGRGIDWPYQPVAAAVSLMLHDPPGRRVVAEVIWDKGSTKTASTTWGSWRSPSMPAIRDEHEVVLVVRKAGLVVGGKVRGLAPAVPGTAPDIGREEFMAGTLSIWRNLGTVSQEGGVAWHPAAFPLRLATRVVRLFSYPGDVVLDPFLGSGTTAVAAAGLGRRWLGAELDPDFAQRARQRIANGATQLGLPGVGDDRPRG